MNQYLASTEFIDWETPAVHAKAEQIGDAAQSEWDLVNTCFIFVRDKIQHSCDYKLNPITCAASEVLTHGTGYCYSKSHLLAALLRANGVPTGLCYQRLKIENDRPPFCLHGLNAVHLSNIGWYRIDARGNKPGVVAEFCPPVEQLAFPIISEGEADLPEIWGEPLTIVTAALRKYRTYEEVAENLPDVQIMKAKNSLNSEI